jgi:cation diffusion facilitator family transporter
MHADVSANATRARSARPQLPVKLRAAAIESSHIRTRHSWLSLCSTMTGVYCNIALALFKFAGGVMGNSMAMIADAVHSLSDLVTDAITLWAARLTHKPQDADHAYGHGKFEAIGSLTISVTLAATAGGIGWSAFESIQTVLSGQNLAVPTGIALVAAMVSIAVKEALYHATLRVGQRWNSKVVKANAWHHRSDSVSTLVAMVGVVGAMVKLPILDPVAGLFVSGLIMKAAIELGWDSLRDLTDENVDPKLQADVAQILASMRDEGVLSFHRLRGRAMGPFVLMDVHISVDPTISVSAAHQIAERARIRVRQKLPVIAEFLVQVDVGPEPTQGRSVFENPLDQPRDEHWSGEVQVLTQKHVAEVVAEYRASKAQADKIRASVELEKGKTPATTTPQSSKLKSSIQSFIDHAAPPKPVAGSSDSASDARAAASSSSASAPMDLSTLMRPQASIERDVRRVLSDPHASYTRHLKGVSHFTCHWNSQAQQLRVQLELAFQTDQLTISQASAVGKAIESSILAQIKDVHAVDIHLELTDAHIRRVKHVEPPRELPPTTTATVTMQ